jgi:hypothetical protein
VADGDVAWEGRKVRVAEDLGDQAHVRTEVNAEAVCRGYAIAFLPAVLEGEQAEERCVCHPLPGQINTNNSAFLAWAFAPARNEGEMGLGGGTMSGGQWQAPALMPVSATPGSLPLSKAGAALRTPFAF